MSNAALSPARSRCSTAPRSAGSSPHLSRSFPNASAWRRLRPSSPSLASRPPSAARACYQPATDTVVLPPFAQFRDAASFYATWLHECGHATGAKHRLARDLTGRFGSAAYALEEIVVELLSGFVLADLGIAHQPRPDHAAYIASWLKVLKEDPRAIFVAASQAQHAADWMHVQQLQPPLSARSDGPQGCPDEIQTLPAPSSSV